MWLQHSRKAISYLMMEAPGSSDTLATIYQIVWRYAPEDCNLKIIIESIGIFLVIPVELLCSILVKDF
jgi:hypothetical protein